MPLPPRKIAAHMYIFCLGNNSGKLLGGVGKETQQPLFTVIITLQQPLPRSVLHGLLSPPPSPAPRGKRLAES